MKKIAKTLVGCFVVVSFSSCNNGNSGSISETESIEYLAAKTLVSGQWVFVSPEMKVIDSPEPSHEATNVINGYFSQNGKLYKMGKTPQLIADGFEVIGDVAENVIPAAKEGEGFAVYDTKGAKLFNIPDYEGHKITHCSPSYHEGLLKVYYEVPNPKERWNPFKHCGYIDHNGNITIPLKWDDAGDFYDNRAVVIDSNDYEDFYVIIDQRGTEIIRIHKSNKLFSEPEQRVANNNYGLNKTTCHKIPHFKDGTIPVTNEETRDNLLLDINGQEVHNFGHDFQGYVADYNGKYAIVVSGGFDGYSYGVIDYAGKQIVDSRYNSMCFIDEDKVLVSIGTYDESYIVDISKGSETKIGNYIEVMYLGNFCFVGKQPVDKSGISFIRNTGSKRIQEDFYKIDGCHFSNIMDHSYSEFSNREYIAIK